MKKNDLKVQFAILGLTPGMHSFVHSKSKLPGKGGTYDRYRIEFQKEVQELEEINEQPKKLNI